MSTLKCSYCEAEYPGIHGISTCPNCRGPLVGEATNETEKECPTCGVVSPATTQTCHCGHEFPGQDQVPPATAAEARGEPGELGVRDWLVAAIFIGVGVAAMVIGLVLYHRGGPAHEIGPLLAVGGGVVAVVAALAIAALVRPIEIVAIVALAYVGTGYGMARTAAALVTDGVPRGGAGSAFVAESVLAIALGLGILILGGYLWKGFSWARIAFIVVVALAMLAAIPALVVASDKYVPVMSMCIGLLYLVLLNHSNTREFCTRGGRAADGGIKR